MRGKFIANRRTPVRPLPARAPLRARGVARSRSAT